MAITIGTFGERDTEQVDLIRISNRSGAHIALIPLGARLVEARFPDRNGAFADVVLGFDSIEDYLGLDTYAGSIAGRYANRISRGRFTVDGKNFELERNEGGNHLHGGHDGLDRQHWGYELDEAGNAVTFRHRSPEGHAGYPGELDVAVVYRLEPDDDVVSIEMTATTSATTVINLVHHSYWNLAGHDAGSVLDHVMQVNAPAYTPVDQELLCTGEIRRVAGTAFDFTVPRPIGERIADVPTTGGGGRVVAGTATGYDHNWVLDGPRHELHPAVVISDPASGRRLTLSTTEPAVQIYTAGYMNDLPGKNGATYNPGAGITLETQTFPCAPNIPWFPSAVLAPGETYRHSMRIAFDVTDES